MATRKGKSRSIFSEADQLQIRQLYVLENKTHKEIADALGKRFSANQIRNLCTRKKWTKDSRYDDAAPGGSELAEAELQAAIAPAKERVLKVLDQAEKDAEELRSMGMRFAREATNGRDLNSCTQTVAKATSMLRDALGIANAGSSGPGSQHLTLNFHGDPQNPFTKAR